ncbi:hypothetical protein DIU36_14150 [Mucilaginibacter rubeus]|nr:hypothetical protein DIU36_14150 [Mucilaginibacter rubeus]
MVNKIHGINGEYNLVFWGIHPKLWFCGVEKDVVNWYTSLCLNLVVTNKHRRPLGRAGASYFTLDAK